LWRYQLFFLASGLFFSFFSAASMAGKGGHCVVGTYRWIYLWDYFLKLLLLSSKTSSGGGLKNVVRRNRSARIQTIRPVSIGQDPDMHGTITITRKESISGTRKLINIPNGFKRTYFRSYTARQFRGKKTQACRSRKRYKSRKNGDLYLKINVED